MCDISQFVTPIGNMFITFDNGYWYFAVNLLCWTVYNF